MPLGGPPGVTRPRSYAVATSAARAPTAAVKHSTGGVTSPAPTCPVPATRPAIPVLICGRVPVRSTAVTSMPVGVPRKSSTGSA